MAPPASMQSFSLGQSSVTSGWHSWRRSSQRTAGACRIERDRLTCCVRHSQKLSNIRLRKGLVSFGRRQEERTRQIVQKIHTPVEAAVQTQDQVAWAASQKLKKALDFRSWSPRGKGLILLNILVRRASVDPCPHANTSYQQFLGRLAVASFYVQKPSQSRDILIYTALVWLKVLLSCILQSLKRLLLCPGRSLRKQLGSCQGL